jgi:hypothetical protein
MHLDRSPVLPASCFHASGFSRTRGVEARHRGGHRIPLRVSKDARDAPLHRSGMADKYSYEAMEVNTAGRKSYIFVF